MSNGCLALTTMFLLESCTKRQHLLDGLLVLGQCSFGLTCTHGWCCFEKKLVSLELPNHNVILDVKTKWNSMYLLVERFTEIYPGLNAATRDQRLKKRIVKDKVDKIQMKI